MSSGINKVILVGNAGSDPDVRITSAGVKVAQVSLATNWRTGGEEPEERYRLASCDPVGPSRPGRRELPGVRQLRARRRDDPDHRNPRPQDG